MNLNPQLDEQPVLADAMLLERLALEKLEYAAEICENDAAAIAALSLFAEG